MPYVTKDLEDEDQKKQEEGGTGGGMSSLAPSSPMSAPSMTAGVGGAQAQPQRNTAQKGTGFIGLQSWLDAGKGRDKAVSDKGSTALRNEQTSFGKASQTAETSLASQNVLAPTGSVAEQLDREAGITPASGMSSGITINPVGGTSQPQQPAPARTLPSSPTGGIPGVNGSGGVVGAMGPGSVRRIGGNTSTTVATPPPKTTISPPVDTTGPTLDQVLNQTYTGPTSIDYKPGQDLTDLALLSNSNTIADVTGRTANEAGEYSKYSGMRALDDALYGSDGASVKAASTNKDNGLAFTKDVDAKNTDFATRAGDRAGRMQAQADATRGELKGIYEKRMKDLADEADAENKRAMYDSQRTDKVLNPETGQYVDVPKGQELGEWEGSSAGTATAANMATADDRKRFSALSKYLGVDAPDEADPYVAGRRTTKSTPGELSIDPSIQLQKEYKDLVAQYAGNKAQTQGATAATTGAGAVMGFDPFSLAAIAMSRMGDVQSQVAENAFRQKYGQAALEWLKKKYGKVGG